MSRNEKRRVDAERGMWQIIVDRRLMRRVKAQAALDGVGIEDVVERLLRFALGLEGGNRSGERGKNGGEAEIPQNLNSSL